MAAKLFSSGGSMVRNQSDSTQRRIGDTGLHLPQQRLPIEAPTDKHDFSLVGFIGLPGTPGPAVERHMHAMKHVSTPLPNERDDALEAKHIVASRLNEAIQPAEEAIGVEFTHWA